MVEEDTKAIERVKEVLRARLFATNPDLKTEKRVDNFLSNKSTPQSRKNAFSTVRSILEHTIVHGSGSSMLILGPPGSGKTWLLNEVLLSLDSDSRCQGNYLLVKLDGLVHTDDHQALLDIAGQLDVEHELGDNVQMPFASAMSYLLETMKKGDKGKMSVVFVLDRFELFARHRNQILLYNLFDIAQADGNPIAVVGLSHNINAADMLEKRVKSRFSHRKVYLFMDYTFEEYVKIFEGLITLPKDFGDRRFLSRWKDSIEKLIGSKEVLETLKALYDSQPGIHALKTLLTVPVSSLSGDHPFLLPADFPGSLLPFEPCPTVTALRGLSVVELTLVVGMNHLSQLDREEPFNFEMVYSEYQKFTRRCSVKLLSKSIAMKAFERLVHMGLVSPTDGWSSSAFLRQGGGGRRTNKEYRMMRLMVMSGQVREAVRNYPNCPTELARWGAEQSMRY